MKQILYEDNNNNANYLINILTQVQQQVETIIRNDVFSITIFDGDMISIYPVKSIKTIGGLSWIWLKTFYIQKWV